MNCGHELPSRRISSVLLPIKFDFESDDAMEKLYGRISFSFIVRP